MTIRTKVVWGACLLVAVLASPAAVMAQTTTSQPTVAAAPPQTSDPGLNNPGHWWPLQ